MFNKSDAIVELRQSIAELTATLDALQSTSKRDVADVRQSYVDRRDMRVVSAKRGPMAFSVNDSELAIPRTAPRARMGRASVRYEIVLKRGQKRLLASEARKASDSMPPAYAAVWDAIVASKTPLTAKELERASGQVKKTVESAVWQLRRTYRLIRSVKA